MLDFVFLIACFFADGLIVFQNVCCFIGKQIRSLPTGTFDFRNSDNLFEMNLNNFIC